MSTCGCNAPSSATIQRNYKSDFDFILRMKDCEGNDIGFPTWDWTLKMWTDIKANAYVVSSIGGVLTNCYNDGGQIHIVCDNHRLSAGKVKTELMAKLPNVIYPDRTEDVTIPMPWEVELVRTPSPCPSTFEVEMSAPIVYLNAYDLAVKAGYEGTLEEYTGYVNRFPAVVETSEAVMRLLGDFDEGKGRIARALTAQGCPTEASEPMAQMAEKIMDLRLAVDGQPGIVDQTMDGVLPTYDLLNELRNHQRADYPYCCGVMFPRVEPMVELKMADAYLCSDGFFTEEQETVHELTDTDRDMSYVIYYFRDRRYTVPTYINPIYQAYALNGHPCWAVANSINEVRSYSTDMGEYTSEELIFPNSFSGQITLMGVKRVNVTRSLGIVWTSLSISFPDLEAFDAAQHYRIFDSIRSVQIYSPNVKYIGGNLMLLYNCPIVQSAELQKLEELNGAVASTCSNLKYLGVRNLKTLTGNGYIAANCNALSRIDANSFESMSGGTAFSGCGALTSMELQSYKHMSGGTLFDNCAALTHAGLDSFTTMSGGTLFKNCPSMSTIPLLSLETIEGASIINYMVETESIFVPNLREAGRYNGEFYLLGAQQNNRAKDLHVYAPKLEWLGLYLYGGNEATITGHIYLHLGAIENGRFVLRFANGATGAHAIVTVEPGFRSYIDASRLTGMTADQLRQLIANLGDNTGYPTLALTLGAANIAKLTEEDIAIATEKNYTVS